ncbi:MAG: sulfatase-like hydrolase/transferase [Bryobacteraceae bacterium]
MYRRTFLASSAGPFVQTASKAAARRPNVVMFMTDDHGAWATGAYGCPEIKTPHIDALAAGGAKFSRAFACTPVCSPSRMTWITGRLPSTHGVQDWLRPNDSFEGATTRRWLAGHPTYTEVLARNGYTLGLSGKWHMGEDDKAQAGFSYWATVPGGGGPYKDVEFVRNGERIKTTGYKTDRVGDYGLEFLDTRRGKDDPFYLLMPFYAPHTPFDYQPDEYRKPYENAEFSCFPKAEKHPWQNRGLAAHHGNRRSMHAYGALITGMDANVGRVVKRLEEMGVRDNTLVVFSADQGWNAGHHGVWGKGNGTWPFNMYEESIRVPLIWNHPGRIAGGQTLDPMVSSYDYFPTILDYLNVDAPKDPKRAGRSYAGFLGGRKPRWSNRLYFEYSYVRGLRTDNLKLIQRTEEWPSEFYDLEADPGETRNLYDDAANGKQRDALRSELDRFFNRAGAPDQEDWRSTTRQELTVYSR